MDKLTPKEASKGAEEIVLTQIKQDFITPANAIFDYVDMVEKVLNDAELTSEDEIAQIKSSCNHLIGQYEEAFVQNTGINAETSNKTPEEYSELRHNLRTPLNAIIGYSEILPGKMKVQVLIILQLELDHHTARQWFQVA